MKKGEYLLIDVGNGRIKLALATRNRILCQRDIPTEKLSTGTFWSVVAGWDNNRTVISSVVPLVTQRLRRILFDEPFEVRHDVDLGIGIRYPKPETIGADRLANAVALAHMHGAPGIVIDFGTAVTFDIVDADSCYVGGVIAPGLRLMTDYLKERTALLPKVELREPKSAIGKSTEAAILSGAALGYRGMVRSILQALRRELGNPRNLKVVATGGDAAWIASDLPEIQVVDKDLTLHGLRLVGNLHAPSPT